MDKINELDNSPKKRIVSNEEALEVVEQLLLDLENDPVLQKMRELVRIHRENAKLK